MHSRLQALQKHLKVKNILSAANLGVKKINADSSSLFNSDSHHTIPKAGMIQEGGEKNDQSFFVQHSFGSVGLQHLRRTNVGHAGPCTPVTRATIF